VVGGIFDARAQMCTFSLTNGAPTSAGTVTGSWAFNCTINFRSPSRFYGIGSTGGAAEIEFDQPIVRFGAYFGANSSDALANGGGRIWFYDVNNTEIAMLQIPITLCGVWEWHGWESSVPLKRIRLASNRVSGAHLMIEDMTADPQPGPPLCYPNCDASTVPPILNVEDFTCFINEFAAASLLPAAQQVDHYANCDGSTTAPVLNVEDFTCFINKFAQGCD
jgi:hypothetical protein